MGIMSAPDIFQDKMSNLCAQLDFVRVYIDDLLVITKDSFDDHLTKLEQLLQLLKDAGLKCNVAKFTFAQHEIRKLGLYTYKRRY